MTDVVWSDGASTGTTPKRALTAALDGKDVSPEDRLDLRTLEQRIMNALPPGDEAYTYDDAVFFLARFMLTTVRVHPEVAAAPINSDYDWSGVTGDGPPSGDYLPPILRKGWDHLLPEIDPDGYQEAIAGISGFQYGLACNYVRAILDLPEAQNPALVVVDSA